MGLNKILGEIILILILTLSVTEVILCGYDKYRAQKKMWRISEKTLLSIAFLGGGIGLASGMLLFRHKTQHKSFKIVSIITSIAYLILFLYVTEHIHLPIVP